MSNPIRLYIVDDQPIIRDGLRYMFDHQPDMAVVGCAATMSAALAEGPAAAANVALLDIRLPDGSGLELAQAMASWTPAPKVILLTTFDVDEYVLAGLRAGAMGYVLKDLPTPELLETIRAVHRGEAMYRTRAASWALSQAMQGASHRLPPETAPELDLLTDREKEVLHRMAYGERNSDIARALFVSEGTIKTHVHSILNKLNLADRTQAVVWAFRHGLVK
ncbi:MAG: response regulator transcription factor [Firmicutes bacterium]|nr:response regulator transcription factor [Bacillota bacterium]